MDSSIDQRVKSVMVKVFRIPENKISPDASPVTIAEWDSLQHMNLIVALEREFSIEFSDNVIGELLDFKSIVKISQEKISDKGER